MNFIRHQWQRFFQAATLLRAWLEVALLCGLLIALVVSIYAPINQDVFIMALLFFVNPCCALYYALRLRPATGNTLQQMGREGLWLTITAAFVGAIGFLTLRLINGSLVVAALGMPHLIFAATLLFSPLFLRTVLRLWGWWAPFYERHLLWSLMNSHLVAVAALQLIIIVPLTLFFALWITPNWTNLNLPRSPLGQFFWQINIALPLLGAAILAACVVLIALIPVSALVSYFLARRIKQRLDALIVAAQTAGSGDYQVRVPVVGQDEIATLQTDFNAMIASLEANMNALRAEREKVVTLLQQRRELFAHVSHDLRTPLATIRVHLESARRRSQDEQTVALSIADVAILERESAGLQSLIDDLFTLARAETDHLSLRLAPLDLLLLLQRIVETVAAPAWQSQRIAISAQLPAALPPVQADHQRLEQVLRNLIHNAIRHTLPGGVIVLSASQQGQYAEIQVRDSGEGIAPADLPHIWERFYHGAHQEGSGLGLALVKSLIEAMNGQVAVQSTRGEGTCFTLTLPLSDQPLA